MRKFIKTRYNDINMEEMNHAELTNDDINHALTPKKNGTETPA